MGSAAEGRILGLNAQKIEYHRGELERSQKFDSELNDHREEKIDVVQWDEGELSH